MTVAILPVRVAVIGQGPNESSWKTSLLIGAKLRPDNPEGFAIDRGRRIACTGRCGETLARLLGMDRLEFYRRTVRLNLNARWNGKEGRGDKFDRAEARAKALEVLRQGYERHVLLGYEVALAFGIPCRFLTVTECRNQITDTPTSFLVFPHPSVPNQFWNDRQNRNRAKLALRQYLGRL